MPVIAKIAVAGVLIIGGNKMITSLSNVKIKNVISLLSKSKQRKQQNVFVVEGIRMAVEAPKDKLREIYVSESFWKKKENQEALAVFPRQILEVVSDEVLRKMSDTVTPQGVLCVVERMEYALLDILEQKGAKDGIYLILEDIQDPGNLGTMLRTGEGAGVLGVMMSKGCVDIYNPKTIRSTMGSVYRVPFCYVEDMKKLIQVLETHNIHTYAAHLEGAKDYDQVKYQGGTAFLIGNEGNGLSPELTALAQTKIRIPMEGQLESLNAAISASILMYEARRQKAK